MSDIITKFIHMQMLLDLTKECGIGRLSSGMNELIKILYKNADFIERTDLEWIVLGHHCRYNHSAREEVNKITQAIMGDTKVGDVLIE